MTLRQRLMLFTGALLLSGTAAFGQGEYQHAKDGKTFIWNGTPRPGETATWDGERDKENYATGFGSLTWYTAKGGVYGLYYGNMIHGKLEGPVNVHLNGRTAHAYFVDGGRVTAWAHGPAPSKMAVPEEVIAEKRKVQAEKTAAAEKKAAIAAEAEKTRQAELNAAKPETKPAQPDQTPKVVEVEKPSSEAMTKEAAPAVAAKQIEARATASPTRAFDEPTPIPARPEIASQTSQSAPLSTPEPSISAAIVNEPPREESPTETKSEAANQPLEATHESPAATKKESPADVSVNALVGPPSSLRETGESSPAKMENEPSTSTDNAPLTEAEAINLADTEARRQGAPLDEYDRPKVDHSAVKGKWSLFYGLKEGRSAAEDGGPFTVTVEDKSRKVEIRK